MNSQTFYIFTEKKKKTKPTNILNQKFSSWISVEHHEKLTSS